MIHAKAATWKKDRVSKLADILKQDGIIAIVDVSGVPATAMLGMREDLRSMMTMTMAKKNTMTTLAKKTRRKRTKEKTSSSLTMKKKMKKKKKKTKTK